VEEPTMKNKITAHLSDSSAKYLVGATILIIAVCVFWISFGDVINGTAHFDFSAFHHLRP
jgi:hypothetical protein